MKRTRNLWMLLFFVLTLPLSAGIRNGADRLEKLLPLLEGKRVGLIVNHTSLLQPSGRHLADTLLACGVQVTAIFAPEHGFRGKADAGEIVSDGKDERTGLPVISLYGKNKKPTPEQLINTDVLIFDIQDVGARFYTYISTMYYALQAAAAQNKEMIVLDRPNPNDFVDGPVLDESLKSFVGALPVPVLHGLTVGELARMIVGEGWAGNNPVKLEVIPVEGWKHGQPYRLPVSPSPNLPNDQAVRLYPSLCFFEATDVSVGRGTPFPFQVIGYPDPRYGSFTSTPVSRPGFDKNPLQKDKKCYGSDLRKATPPEGLSLHYFMDFYRISGKGNEFISRPEFFDKLTGDKQLREDLAGNKTEEQIKARWKEGLDEYRRTRAKYLLYPDQKP